MEQLERDTQPQGSVQPTHLLMRLATPWECAMMVLRMTVIGEVSSCHPLERCMVKLNGHLAAKAYYPAKRPTNV
jgi:hypothetical protein